MELRLYALKIEGFVNIEHLKEYYSELDDSGELKFIIGNINTEQNVILVRTSLSLEQLEVIGVKVTMYVDNDAYFKICSNDELLELFCKLIDNL